MRGTKAKQLRRMVYGGEYAYTIRKYNPITTFLKNIFGSKEEKDKVSVVNPIKDEGLRRLYQDTKKLFKRFKLKDHRNLRLKTQRGGK